jgi:hypothetical protein
MKLIPWLAAFCALFCTPAHADPRFGRAWPPAWEYFDERPASPVVELRPLLDRDLFLATFEDGTLGIVNAANGRVMRSAKPVEGKIGQLEIRHDAREALLGTSKSGLAVLELPSLKLKYTLSKGQSATRFSLSPDGDRVLIRRSSEGAALCEVRDGAPETPIPHRGKGFGWLPDSRRYVVLEGRMNEWKLSVYDSADHRKIGELNGYNSGDAEFLVTRDGQWLACHNGEDEIAFWSAAGPAALTPEAPPLEPVSRWKNLSPLWLAAFRDQPKVTLAGLAEFNPASTERLPWINPPRENEMAAAVLANGTVGFTKPNGNLCAWDGARVDLGARWTLPVPPPEPRQDYPVQPGEIAEEREKKDNGQFGGKFVHTFVLNFPPDPSAGATDPRREVHIIDPATGGLVRKFLVPEDIKYINVDYARDGSYAAIMTGKQGRWAAGAEERRMLRGLSGPVGDTAPSLFILRPGSPEPISHDLWLSESARGVIDSRDSRTVVAYSMMEEDYRATFRLYDMTREIPEPGEAHYLSPGGRWRLLPLAPDRLMFNLLDGDFVIYRTFEGKWVEYTRRRGMIRGSDHVRVSPDQDLALAYNQRGPAAQIVSLPGLEERGWVIPFMGLGEVEWPAQNLLRVTEREIVQEFRLPDDQFPAQSAFIRYSGLINAVAVSQDYTDLAIADSQQLRLYDYSNGKQLSSVKLQGFQVQRLIYLSEDMVIGWDQGTTWKAWKTRPKLEEAGTWTDIDRKTFPVLKGKQVKFEKSKSPERYPVIETFSHPRLAILGKEGEIPFPTSEHLGPWMQIPGEDAIVLVEKDFMWLLTLPEGRPIHQWLVTDTTSLGYNPSTREVITGGLNGGLQKYKLPPKK